MMRIKVKVFTLLIGLLVIGQTARAQQEFTLYHMPVLSQSTFLNSAAIPEHKISISLPIPSTFIGFNNSAFSVKELMDKSGKIDFNKFTSGLSKNKNYIGVGANIELFHLRVKAIDNFFSFQSRFVNDLRFFYPKDLLALGTEGIKDGYSLSGLDIDFSSYFEHAIGFTRAKPDSRWTYGGKLKLLKGVANVQTKSSQIELQVDNENLYQYDLTADMEVNVGVGLDKSKFTSFEDIGDINFDFDCLISGDCAADLFKVSDIQLSNGFAMDAAATYQLTRRITLGAALNNLGYINWKSFTQNYKGSSSLTFDGVNIDDLDFSQNLDSLINSQLDSTLSALSDQFSNSIDTTNNAYKSGLPANLFLSAHLQLNPRVRASASLYTEFFNGSSFGIVTGLNMSIARGFDLTTTWWWFRNSSANLGLGMVFRPGPVQFYLVMDNILPASLVKINDSEQGIDNLYLPYQIKNFNLRIGMNLVFGRIKDESRLAKSGLTRQRHGMKRYTYKPSNK